MTQITLSYGSDSELSLKKGDQRPALELILERGRIHTETVDLTDAAEVRLYVQNESTGDLLVDQAMTIANAAAGEVEYEFGANDIVQGGQNEFEVVVEWSDGEPESWPKRGYGVIHAAEPLGRELDPADIDDPDLSVGVLTATEVRSNTLGGRSGNSLEMLSDLDLTSHVIQNQDLQTVASESDLVDGEPGFYEVTNTGQVIYFDGDTSTNSSTN
ncbi:hypothetical protein [Haloferax volcanii]|uniref:hypothetical protein n=1 Tax=Haloferax volcanii TaxID=2246 RepID=UPI00249C8AD2|nr:hypothetical protein [Haloferax alexandrinus]WEL29843.1 hypothetical protein HBNXHx_1737 [Haloferax alexandrinus]